MDIREIEEKLQKATLMLRDAETEKKIAESKLNDVKTEIAKITEECINETGSAPDKLGEIIENKKKELASIIEKINEIEFSDDDSVMFSQENLDKINAVYEQYKDIITNGKKDEESDEDEKEE